MGAQLDKRVGVDPVRAMGWNDDGDTYFHRAEAVNRNTQLYKRAGNSIVVPVLEAIFTKMFV